MSNYIHIQQGYIDRQQCSYRVLMRANNDCWSLFIGDKLIDLTPSIERFWAYWIFVKGSRREIAIWIREELRIDISPTDLDKAIQYFRQEHPKEILDHYSLDEVPTAANAKGLELPIPYYRAIISLEQEKHLLKLIQKMPHKDLIMRNLKAWFSWFVMEYGYNFKKCKGEEALYLAQSFLQQHAIDIDLPLANNTPKINKNRRGAKVAYYVYLILLLPVFIGGMIALGNNFMDNGLIFVGFILLFVGFIALAVFLDGFFFRKNK